MSAPQTMYQYYKEKERNDKISLQNAIIQISKLHNFIVHSCYHSCARANGLNYPGHESSTKEPLTHNNYTKNFKKSI